MEAAGITHQASSDVDVYGRECECCCLFSVPVHVLLRATQTLHLQALSSAEQPRGAAQALCSGSVLSGI